MIRVVRPDQVRYILALADELGPEVLEQARKDLESMTIEVARFYIDTLHQELRRAAVS